MFEITNHGICKVAVAPVRAHASDEAEIVTQLLFGDYVQIIQAGKPWIRIRFEKDNYEGWMDYKQLSYITDIQYNREYKLKHQLIHNATLNIYGSSGQQTLLIGGTLPNFDGEHFSLGQEQFRIMDDLEEARPSVLDTALVFQNSPYLWGGKSLFGIDCSGLTQNIARLHGLNVPRDASQQVSYGETVSFEDRRAGDILFFVNDKGKVHHVGILLDEDIILHAAGYVRQDRLDETGIFRVDFEEYTHKLHSIKRWF